MGTRGGPELLPSPLHPLPPCCSPALQREDQLLSLRSRVEMSIIALIKYALGGSARSCVQQTWSCGCRGATVPDGEQSQEHHQRHAGALGYPR